LTAIAINLSTPKLQLPALPVALTFSSSFPPPLLTTTVAAAGPAGGMHPSWLSRPHNQIEIDAKRIEIASG
jgi:hypothetical protein